MTFGNDFNQNVSHILSSTMTHLTFRHKSNQPMENFPSSLTHLTFGQPPHHHNITFESATSHCREQFQPHLLFYFILILILFYFTCIIFFYIQAGGVTNFLAYSKSADNVPSRESPHSLLSFYYLFPFLDNRFSRQQDGTTVL
jgi:hypothetical protein